MDITRTLSYTHDVSHDIIYCNTMMMKEINFISLETTMKNLSYPQIVNYMPTSLQYHFLKVYFTYTLYVTFTLHIYIYILIHTISSFLKTNVMDPQCQLFCLIVMCISCIICLYITAIYLIQSV